MRNWLLALPLLLAGATAVDAAVFPLEGSIIEVTERAPNDNLTVEIGDLFSGSISYNPAQLASIGVAPVEDLTFNFSGALITDADMVPGAVVIDTGAGLIVSVNVPMVSSDVLNALGATGPLSFAGAGPNTVVFSDAIGPIITGEFSVVPVPAALPLLATGLVGLVWLRRRQKG